MAVEREALHVELERRDEEPARALLERVDAAPSAAPDETADLVAGARRGDTVAREELIQRFLPYVSALARSFRADGLDNADLVQEGCAGLLRALSSYDPTRGVPFAAYATWWIRQALQEARGDYMRPLRLPPKALRQLARLKSEHQRVYADERRQPGTRELAERTAIRLEQVEALLAADAGAHSLDEPVAGAEGQIGTLGDLLADPLSADEFEDVLDAIAGRQLRALLGRLTEQERDVLSSRFGFDRPPEKLAEVGDRLGLSAERVRQIEQRALVKLRRAS